jgi:formylglycine-generating enzyme
MKASLKAIIISTLLLASCSDETLQQVSVAEFRNFISETNYITDAEKYGWSIVQKTVFEYEIVYGVNWECPIGYKYAGDKKPVTQISYNDAEAYYAQWSHIKIPTYEEY